MDITMNNMVDIHSHILPNIDDGSKSLEESITIIKKLEQLGFTDIVFTPHFILSTPYQSSILENQKLLEKIKQNIDSNINLYLGNEVFACMEMVSYLKNMKMSTINNSRYVLFELPRNSKLNDLNELIFSLKINKFIPVLAHPERYMILKDKNVIDDLIERGVYFEVNYESIIGKYGKDVKKTAKYLLKNKKFHFLATDIHRADSSFFKDFKKIKKKIIRLIGKDYFTKVTYYNPINVINDKDII